MSISITGMKREQVDGFVDNLKKSILDAIDRGYDIGVEVFYHSKDIYWGDGTEKYGSGEIVDKQYLGTSVTIHIPKEVQYLERK